MMNDWGELQAGSRAADDAWPRYRTDFTASNTPTSVVSLDVYVVLFYLFGFWTSLKYLRESQTISVFEYSLLCTPPQTSHELSRRGYRFDC